MTTQLISHRAKLKPAQVRRLRELWQTGRYSQSALGRKFKISQSAVSMLLNGKTYLKVAA